VEGDRLPVEVGASAVQMSCCANRLVERKTTKCDFLSHFANPQLDLLACVLAMKLQPLYFQIAQKIQYPTG
jgi:hypothetical protein